MAHTSRERPGLSGYVDRLVADLLRLIPQAINNGQSDAIHDARVTTRRISAALALLRPVLTDGQRRPFAKVLRRLRRRLRPLRDLDVMIEHLQTEQAGTRRYGPPAAWLLEHLRGQRQKLQQELARRLTASKLLAQVAEHWASLRPQILEADEAVHGCLAGSLAEQAERFAALANSLAGHRRDQELRGEVGQPSPADEPNRHGNPHLLRIAGKALRYTLEIAKASRQPVPAVAIRTFKRMQDALGLWHDQVVLANTALSISVDESLAYDDLSLDRAVVALAQATLGRAVSHWRAFRRLWAAKGAGLEQTIRSLSPPVRLATDLAGQGDGAPGGDNGRPSAQVPGRGGLYTI